MGSTSELQASSFREPPNSTEPPPGIEVKLKHPGYHAGRTGRQNTLISLIGLDRDGERVGLYFGTASTICGIISGRKDGFFTKERDDPPLDLLEDDLLEHHTYYYHITNDPRYAIYPSFEHWPFPHDELPPPYNQAAPCALTQFNMTDYAGGSASRSEMPSLRLPGRAGLTKSALMS